MVKRHFGHPGLSFCLFSFFFCLLSFFFCLNMMKNINLKYALGLPPDKAVEYFRSKGYTFSWDWWEVWQQAHAKAFTVAKAMQMDVLQDIREMVDRAIEEGLTFRQFRAELEPRLKAKGWWGKVWAVDEQGRDLYSVDGGETQREMARRFGVNLVMYVLTGNYKDDQVHLPALLERLGDGEAPEEAPVRLPGNILDGGPR